MRRVISRQLRARGLVLAAVVSMLGLGIALAPMLRVNPHSASGANKFSLERAFSSTNPESIYAADPADAWNRIFHSLFSRTIKARIADDLSDKGPFTIIEDGMSGVRASTATFDRFEVGDRAIDPLYPSFLIDTGVRAILTEPDFSQLKQALTSALNETRSRPPLARALMQSDAWGAYDILFETKNFRGPDANLFAQRRGELLSLLGRFIKKIALSSDEIRSLPDNYSLACEEFSLPDLFATNGQWLEIQSSPHRSHDFAANFRRSSRVFVKPVDPSLGKDKLLNSLRQENFFALVDSVALVTQNLLIDSSYTPVPTHLTIEFQIRTFVRDARGNLVRTDLRQYEINRRSVLSGRTKGGLVEIDDKAGVYLPTAGNDYQFATPQFGRTGTDYAVLISLRRRCQTCHGPRVSTIFTLSSHHPPPLPLLTVLEAKENVHGWYVAGRKWEREEFQRLRRQQ